MDTVNQQSAVRNFYKYSAGANASRWKEDQKLGIMAINFRKFNTGSLNQYSSREALGTALGVDYKKLNNCWNMWLFKEANIGDVIIANNGVNTVLGFGIITGPYEYWENEPEYRHRRKVDWIATAEWKYSPNQIPGYSELHPQRRRYYFRPALLHPKCRHFPSQFPASALYKWSTAFAGADSFQVMVSDGTNSDVVTVYVGMTPGCPMAVKSLANTAKGLYIYPNPATNTLNVNLNSATANAVPFTISDVTNRILATTTLTGSAGHISGTINIASYPAGIYFLTAQGGESVKFVKE